MSKKKKATKVEITVNYPADRTMSEAEIAALKEKLKCATVLVLPDRIRVSQVIVSTRFR